MTPVKQDLYIPTTPLSAHPGGARRTRAKRRKGGKRKTQTTPSSYISFWVRPEDLWKREFKLNEKPKLRFRSFLCMKLYQYLKLTERLPESLFLGRGPSDMSQKKLLWGVPWWPRG